MIRTIIIAVIAFLLGYFYHKSFSLDPNQGSIVENGINKIKNDAIVKHKGFYDTYLAALKMKKNYDPKKDYVKEAMVYADSMLSVELRDTNLK